MTMPPGITQVVPAIGGGGRRGGGNVPAGPPYLPGIQEGGLERRVSIYLPEIYPIPDAIEFNVLGSKDTAGAEAGIAITGTRLELPKGNVGIIRGVNIYIDNMLLTTVVSYSLQINGAPPSGYGPLTIFPRVAPSVGNSFDSFIRVSAGATIEFFYTNTDGGAYKVGGGYSGWHWPESSGARWLASGS